MVVRLPKQLRTALAALLLYLTLFYIIDEIDAPAKIGEYLPDLPALPIVKLDYGASPYNESKVAFLTENRENGVLAPVIVHYISVLPHDWKIRFMGSQESIAYVKRSAAIRRQIKIGKLDVGLIPSNVSLNGQEMISRFLTSLWLYEHVLRPAEFLLIFQTDSMMCTNHKGTLDEWLGYDWVGAPWSGDSRFGGNGGLSFRRVSSMVRVLQHQQRLEHSEPEDVWLTERLGHLPDTKAANGTMSVKFSAESIYSEEPLGYHTGGGGAWLAGGVWGTLEKRQHIWDYCPEMKMTIEMDMKQFMPDLCQQEW